MAGTLPASPAPARIEIGSIQPSLVSVAHSLKRQTRSRGGQRWGFALTFVNRTRAQIATLAAFALAQRGQYETFSFSPPVFGLTQSVVSGAPVVDGAQTVGRSIVTDGWANSVTAMKAGEFVKFANHAKVYMLTADVTSNGSGQATISIEPALYAAVANDEAITVTSVPFTCAFLSDSHEIALNAGPLFSWQCELIESP